MSAAFSHEDVLDLLGPYVDGELPEVLLGRVTAHVAACEPCGRAVAVQKEARERLAVLAIPGAPPKLLVRLAAALDAEPEALPAPAPPKRTPATTLQRRAVAWAGWAVAAGLGLVLLFPPGWSRRGGSRLEAPTPPMVESALAGFRHLAHEELPPACDAMAAHGELPFAEAPLRTPLAHPVSCWRTTLQGQPVSAWAYRWRDRLVVAYVVPESLFFRQPAVREAVVRAGRYALADGRQGVVAWPAEKSGVLLVGDASPAELEELRL